MESLFFVIPAYLSCCNAHLAREVQAGEDKLYVWGMGHRSLVLWLVDLISVLAQDLGNARKFSIIGFYPICEGGLVKMSGGGRWVGGDSGGGPVC